MTLIVDLGLCSRWQHFSHYELNISVIAYSLFPSFLVQYLRHCGLDPQSHQGLKLFHLSKPQEILNQVQDDVDSRSWIVFKMATFQSLLTHSFRHCGFTLSVITNSIFPSLRTHYFHHFWFNISVIAG